MKQTKRVFAVLLCAIMITAFIPATFASAETYSGTCGDNLTWTLNTDTGVLTISGTGDMTTFFTDRNVPWYDYREIITSVVINDSVTSIGKSAFENCTALTNVTIGKKVTLIDTYAFRSCTALTSITIPDNVTLIGKQSFSKCTALTSITIPNNITLIDEGSFIGCVGLKSVAIPNSVTSIGNSAFSGCTDLTSIVIPNSVTSIGNYAFSTCKSLTNIKIPDSVISIGEEAFRDCSALTTVTIGSGLTDIGRQAFSDCSEFKVSEQNTSFCSVNGILFNKDATKLIQYPLHSSATTYSVSNNVTAIGEYAFAGSSLLTITIPNSVTSIGDYAFYQCSSLTSITIPNSVTSIANGLFSDCESLTNVVIPNSVMTIGDYAFYSCSLTGITIPNSVTTIGECAFYDSALLTITIPNSVVTIGKAAFGLCNSLTNVTILNGITSIENYLFSDCNSLVSVIIPNSVISIGESAFWGCTALTNMTIPDSVTTIGEYAFAGCTSLTNVTISNSLTEISHGMFEDCDSLTHVTIPNSVKAIGWDVFWYCTSLTTVTIPDSVTTIGSWSFYYCSSLSDVYYAGTEEQWNSIEIGGYNDELLNATIHYNTLGASFDTGSDIWNFANSSSVFGNASEGYEIYYNDYMRFIWYLAPTERNAATRYSDTISHYNVLADSTGSLSQPSEHTKWGGSCYGMSSWSFLAKNGVLSAADIDSSASNLHDVKFSKKTESAINFYHNQQYLSTYVNPRNSFMRLSQSSQLQTLETLAENANNGGSPVFISYQWYKDFNSDGTCDTSSGSGHAVVGYGLEEGTFKCTEPSGAIGTYNRKVLIYDCAYPSGGDKYDLYFNTDTGRWCIPGHNIVSTDSQTRNSVYNNGMLKLVTNDISLVNAVDYNTGNMSDALIAFEKGTASITARSNASYTISWGDYSCTVEGLTVTENTSDEDIIVIMSDNIDTEGNSYEATATIVLPSSDYSYSVTSDDSLAFSVNYGDYLESVASPSGGTVTFSYDGETSVLLDSAADCTISLTGNDLNTSYDTFIVTSSDAAEVTASLADSGILVTSDNADDVSVFANNAFESAGITIPSGSENMLITETDGTLSAWSDDNNSGEYTTPIAYEEIVSWSIDGYYEGIVTLTAPSDAEGDYYLAIAQYDENDTLIDCEVAVISAESEKTSYQITTEKALSDGIIKIMLWDKNLIPLTKAYEY